MERAAVAELKAAAAIPARCGPAIVPAPARGAFAVFSPREMVPGSAERSRHAGFDGRDAVRQADAFDRMEARVRARWSSLPERFRPPFVPPFTPGQVAVGRRYLALVERCEAGGIKCASLEAGRSGGTGGGFSEAIAADRAELNRMRARIGDRAAMTVRRVRPSDRGVEQRGIISDLALVNHVCLEGRTIKEVLVRYKWVGPKGWPKADHVKLLRQALCLALDRMQGYSG
ncbi:MAG: hypothetical protein MUE98_00245 [Rhodobacteraceae bacterium]|nr:hypothetical protein [Paracoccaceae bacterium]